MYKERLSFSLQHFMASYLLLAALMLGLKIFELGVCRALPDWSLVQFHPVWSTLLREVAYTAYLGLWALPFYVLVYLMIGSFTRYLLGFLFYLFLIGYALLIGYYLTTGVPLGSDLWGYTLDDILLTLGSSGSFSLLPALPLLAVIACMRLFFGRIQEAEFQTRPLLVLYGVMLAGGILFKAWPVNQQEFTSFQDYNRAVNKFGYLSDKTYQQWKAERAATDIQLAGYPLFKPLGEADVLGAYLDSSITRPDLVIVMVEGLGGCFVGPHARFAGAVPFLDSLAGKSLFWENGLSTTGRTFGVLPAITGSLPFGQNGFMDLGRQMPDHQTLFTELNKAGYLTSYCYGGNVNFDNQDIFLERQMTGQIISEATFSGSRFEQANPKERRGTWGFPDKDLFAFSLEKLKESPQPRFTVYMTLSTHEPFEVPQQSKYLAEAEAFAARSKPEAATIIKQHLKEFASLRYTDDALRDFIGAFRKRREYRNTIFIITGDHRMIPLPEPDPLDRFHVPVIIYSPGLKRHAAFPSLVTHHDLYPTLLHYLKHRRVISGEASYAYLGHLLDTSATFHSMVDNAFMRNKGDLSDYIERDVIYADGNAYRIKPDLTLEAERSSEITGRLAGKLQKFRELNDYLVAQNKIIPEGLAVPRVAGEYAFTPREKWMIKLMVGDSANPDDILREASRRAAKRQFTNCRLLCYKVLEKSPNYTDARVLLGSTFLWEGKFREGRAALEEAYRRNPESEETLMAILRSYLWEGKSPVPGKWVREAARFRENTELQKISRQLSTVR